ncbi:hypothetical protein FHS18_006934 [Paenibacillus phyllosphaerae]|uniref:Uncharacterized protein n=1 Tax=Paenibacillus phyllosphaerae TaxID=274593 RepID=A0A7W5B5Y1_9BACL|nr:hypothetical protein [Paenibacillus phyllosphaerae]MBB3114774.1 hypothetical protein [Paenibacillus phyllosphaerae]
MVKQLGLVVLVLAIMSLVSACRSDNTDKTSRPETTMEVQNKDQEKELSNNGTNTTPDKESIEKFSYLNQLSLDKQEAFTRFTAEKSLHNLYNFTPEDMVLVYLYCLSIGRPRFDI